MITITYMSDDEINNLVHDKIFTTARDIKNILLLSVNDPNQKIPAKEVISIIDNVVKETERIYYCGVRVNDERRSN